MQAASHAYRASGTPWLCPRAEVLHACESKFDLASTPARELSDELRGQWID